MHQPVLVPPVRNWRPNAAGYCYRKLEDYESALKVYLHGLELKPDDIRTETLIGFCNLKLERYDVALKHYFKIDYLNPGTTSIIRPIAWSYFALGEYGKAESYYRKVFDLSPDYYDYINHGHLKWVQGDRKAAVENYILSTSYESLNFSDLQRIMEDDRNVLAEKGISAEEFYLMMDFLRYRMKG